MQRLRLGGDLLEGGENLPIVRGEGQSLRQTPGIRRRFCVGLHLLGLQVIDAVGNAEPVGVFGKVFLVQRVCRQEGVDDHRKLNQPGAVARGLVDLAAVALMERLSRRPHSDEQTIEDGAQVVTGGQLEVSFRVQEGVDCGGDGAAMGMAEHRDQAQATRKRLHGIVQRAESFIAQDIPCHANHKEVVAGLVKDQFGWNTRVGAAQHGGEGRLLKDRCVVGGDAEIFGVKAHDRDPGRVRVLKQRTEAEVAVLEEREGFEGVRWLSVSMWHRAWLGCGSDCKYRGRCDTVREGERERRDGSVKSGWGGVVGEFAWTAFETFVVPTRQPARDGGASRAVVRTLLKHALSQDADHLAAEEKRELLSRLLSRLAHEIRNPLSSLDIHAQLLLEDVAGASEPARGMLLDRLGIIRAEIHRLNAIVEQFVRLADHSELNLGPVDLPAVVKHIDGLLKPELSRRKIELQLDLPARWPACSGDQGQLTQALVNLVINAIQAIESNGVVLLRIGAPEDGEGVDIHVEDDGPGIPAEQMESVFEPFFTTREEGSGLGLWIVRQIVSAHGGSVRARNRLERGVCFEIHLPQHPPPPAHG